jgi:hypothetical protein
MFARRRNAPARHRDSGGARRGYVTPEVTRRMNMWFRRPEIHNSDGFVVGCGRPKTGRKYWASAIGSLLGQFLLGVESGGIV